MNLILRSEVPVSMAKVASRFDVHLFKFLLPPGAKLIEFGGSEKGDRVHLKLPLVGEWISDITENGETENAWYFVDVGTKLPFPLKSWTHRHVLHAVEDRTVIEDDIHFSTGWLLGDVLFYPILYASFYPRIRQYKAYFKE